MNEKQEKYFYYNNCVTYPNIGELHYIIDNSKQIEYNTFSRKVDLNNYREITKQLEYGKNSCIKHMHHDWHVSYHSSKDLKGNRVYYFSHSCIEYIFKQGHKAYNEYIKNK